MVRISNYLKGLTLVSMMSVATMTLQSCSDSDNFTAVDNADPTLLLSQSTILTEIDYDFCCAVNHPKRCNIKNETTKIIHQQEIIK